MAMIENEGNKSLYELAKTNHALYKHLEMHTNYLNMYDK